MHGNKVIYSVEDVGSISFGDTQPYFCESFEGTSVASNCQTNTAIGMDGQLVSDVTLQPKVVTCKFAVVSLSKAQNAYDYEGLERMKGDIVKLFNPKMTGVLTRINSRGVFQVIARPSETPVFEKAVGASCRFSMNFVLDKPVWRGTKERVYRFTEPGELTVFNSSGVELPIIIKGTIPANGTFSIENLTNGKAIHYKKSKNFDAKIEVDTDTCAVMAQKVVNGNMERANYIFSASSDLDMILDIGENVLRYSVEGTCFDDERALSVAVFDRYIGVV